MDPLQTVRKAITLFFLGFPLVIISLLFFISIGLGNVGAMLLLIGHVLVVPIAVFLLHIVTHFLPFSHVPASDIGLLIPSTPYSDTMFNVAPSYWVAHTVFFCVYILTNAVHVYQMNPYSDVAAQWKIENRKGRASMAIVASVAILIVMLALRYSVTNTETFLGMLLGVGAFSALSVGWYLLTRRVGMRFGDFFGVVQQMLATEPDLKRTTVCAATAPTPGSTSPTAI